MTRGRLSPVFAAGGASTARRRLVWLAIALAATAAIAAAGAAQAGARDTAARPAAATLQLGSRGPAVRSLQTSLVRLTYLPAGAADGIYGMRTWHAVVAFQGWQRLVRDGIAGPRTLAAMARAKPPAPWSMATDIEVHISRQVLLLVSGGRVQRAIHVATGMPGWPTPVGRFTILSRQAMSWSVPFQAWMPLAQYFYPGYAMHEYPEVPACPASHGCVRIPAAEAGVVWRFGRLGMRAWVG
jgi:hypothetical protein